MPIFDRLYHHLNRSQRCTRCSGVFPFDQTDCHHCQTVSEQKLGQLRTKLERQRAAFWLTRLVFVISLLFGLVLFSWA